MVQLQEVKDYLGITYNSDDVRIKAILDATNELLVNYIGDYTEGEKTVQIYNNTVKNGLIGFKHIGVEDIKSINGVDFTGKGSEYKLLDDKGQARILDLSSYIANDFGVFEVIYNAGYTTTPNDITRAVSTLVGYYYSQDLGKDVKTEQTGPRQVEYRINQTDDGQRVLTRFYKSLNKYIPLHLRVWS